MHCYQLRKAVHFRPILSKFSKNTWFKDWTLHDRFGVGACLLHLMHKNWFRSTRSFILASRVMRRVRYTPLILSIRIVYRPGKPWQPSRSQQLHQLVFLWYWQTRWKQQDICVDVSHLHLNALLRRLDEDDTSGWFDALCSCSRAWAPTGRMWFSAPLSSTPQPTWYGTEMPTKVNFNYQISVRNYLLW